MKFVEHFPPPPARPLTDKEKLAIEAAHREALAAGNRLGVTEEEIEKAINAALGRKPRCLTTKIS
jgi:hypothetical protein